MVRQDDFGFTPWSQTVYGGRYSEKETGNPTY